MKVQPFYAARAWGRIFVKKVSVSGTKEQLEAAYQVFKQAGVRCLRNNRTGRLLLIVDHDDPKVVRKLLKSAKPC